MKSVQSIRLGLWLLIGFNLLMALGSIWIFMRMAPAIEVIIDRNGRTLMAGEEMLTTLALITDDANVNDALKIRFEEALKRARDNITETDEPGVIKTITMAFPKAFQGDIVAREHMVSAIVLLGKMNRDAMMKADIQARQLGYAGAWGIVFMAVAVFFAGMLLKRNISLHLFEPMEEIQAVLSAHQQGDTLRRFTRTNLSRDNENMFHGLNELLDKADGSIS